MPNQTYKQFIEICKNNFLILHTSTYIVENNIKNSPIKNKLLNSSITVSGPPT